MSEADTPQEANQSQSFPQSTDSPMDDPVEDPVKDETDPNLDPVQETAPAQDETLVEVIEVVSLVHRSPALVDDEANAAKTTDDGDGVHREKSEPQSLPAEAGNLFPLLAEMRQRNRDLVSRVNHLEKALGDCQEALQLQRQRSQAQENILTSTTQELNGTQEQVTRMFRELESSHQAAQRQQILIETVTEQLENSQERIAQLERECAFTQQRYNEQSHALLQSENTIRELRTRLQRQQRQTLQFKSALEKCLEMPPPTQIEPDTRPSPTWAHRHLKNAHDSQSLLPKAPPIQPWSAQPAFQEDSAQNEEDWEISVPSPAYAPITEATAFVSREWEPLEEIPASESLEATDEEEIWQWGMLDSDSDPLMDDFLMPPELEISDNDDFSDELAIASTQESIAIENELEDLLLAVSFEPDENDEAGTIYALENAESASPSSYIFEPSEPEAIWSEDASGDNAEQEEEVISRREFPAAVPTQRPDAIPSQPNWPSPLLYPTRPPKGRKSLASIELPTFPRKTGA
ncbi:hypothetical protein NDI49_22820 [Trichocoleus sp. ST-U3]|uniref:hypothetical protein n=1 Tax=Coleofasciculus sp. FACHB-542 TaxID=2692787 RepID=UPI001684AB98|nr:hypothetical protein [Coleofasciculus sp. FACHB-542]MBD2084969.1 hypothetical protein [Coleofasciculus sp. FACHB-542]